MSAFGNNLREWLTRLNDWSRTGGSGTVKSEHQSTFSTTEKVIVFIFAYIIAIGLWLMVNLDRDFNLNLRLALVTGDIDSDMALVSTIPDYVNVSVTGEGWKLLNLYGNPPVIPVHMEDSNIDLTEQVRNIIGGYQNIFVTRVQPSILNVSLEQRISKTVPVEFRSDLTFARQFNAIGDPKIEPDSVTVTGAMSRIESVEIWPTVELRRENVRETLDLDVALESPHAVIQLDHDMVRVTIEIAEFTEGELRIPVRVRGMPVGRNVIFNPSSITVRYDVPIDKYQESQDLNPFVAYVDYVDLLNDTTGQAFPEIVNVTEFPNLRIKSTQPRSVAYFIVVTN